MKSAVVIKYNLKMYVFVCLFVTLFSSQYVTFSSAMPAPDDQDYNVGDAYQFLNEAVVKTDKDIEGMIEKLVQNTETQYQQGVQQLQKWNENEILSPYMDDAQTGLTIARDNLNKAAEETLAKVSSQISTAQSTMDPEEFLDFLKQMPKVIEIETKPSLIYFLEAFDAINNIGMQMGNSGSEQLTQSGNDAYEQLKQFSDKTSGQAMNMANQTSGSLRELGGDVSGQMMQTGKDAQKRLQQTGEQMSEMAGKGSRQLSQMGEEACKKGSQMGGKMSGQMSKMGNGAQKRLNEMGGQVSQQVPQMGEKMSNQMSEMGENAYGQLNQLSDKTTSQLSQMGEETTSQLQNGMSSMQGAGRSLTNSVSEAASGVPIPKSVSL